MVGSSTVWRLQRLQIISLPVSALKMCMIIDGSIAGTQAT
jgi:hypothetical protein